MKLDKIKFARLMNVLSRWGLCELAEADIVELDNIIDIEATPINAQELHKLMSLMQAGTSKIDAIKQYCAITGFGLVDSKNAIEKYWNAKPIV